MPSHAGAILRAQALSMWKLGRGESLAGRIVALVPAVAWYGIWGAVALAAALFLPEAGSDELGPVAVWAFLALLLYWQMAPLFTTARGASLDLNKLRVYPVPEGQLFLIEVVLRVTTGAECMIALTGIAIGLLRHRSVPFWAPVAAAALFTAMNLLLAAGLRNLIDRLLGYRRVRELLALVAVTLVVLPQLLTTSGIRAEAFGRFWERHPGAWPWTAAGDLAVGRSGAVNAAVLLLWTVAAGLFARRQFHKWLRFDVSEAGAARRRAQPPGIAGALFRLPAFVLPDPIAALIEKELRTLARTPRFRVLFIMGFTFGVLVWFPMARRSGALGANLPVLVSVYALLLLGEPLIWNVFGFDRASVQYYFSAPNALSRVLAAKNVAAFVTVFAEISLVLAICSLLPFRLRPGKVLEAYAITLAMTVYSCAAGNLTSVYAPRPLNPEQTWGGSSPGKAQFLILFLYPALGAPLLLAYGARYAFRTETAFYGVLAVVTAMGLVIRSVATDSALRAAHERRERMLAALGEAGGPVSN